MNEKIFVVAGNYEQFKHFRSNLINTMIDQGIDVIESNITYVDKDRLYGYDNVWGYKVGTWKERKDIDDICKIGRAHV